MRATPDVAVCFKSERFNGNWQGAHSTLLSSGCDTAITVINRFWNSCQSVWSDRVSVLVFFSLWWSDIWPIVFTLFVMWHLLWLWGSECGERWVELITRVFGESTEIVFYTKKNVNSSAIPVTLLIPIPDQGFTVVQQLVTTSKEVWHGGTCTLPGYCWNVSMANMYGWGV